MLLGFIDQKNPKFRNSYKRAIIFWKSEIAGAGAIVKNRGAVRKCVQINYWSAGVRAAHSKISSNPTSADLV